MWRIRHFILQQHVQLQPKLFRGQSLKVEHYDAGGGSSALAATAFRDSRTSCRQGAFVQFAAFAISAMVMPRLLPLMHFDCINLRDCQENDV